MTPVSLHLTGLDGCAIEFASPLAAAEPAIGCGRRPFVPMHACFGTPAGCADKARWFAASGNPKWSPTGIHWLRPVRARTFALASPESALSVVVQRPPSLDCADDFIQARKTVSWLEPRTHQSTGKTSEIVKERLWFYSSCYERQDFARDYIYFVFNQVQPVHSGGARNLCIPSQRAWRPGLDGGQRGRGHDHLRKLFPQYSCHFERDGSSRGPVSAASHHPPNCH